MSLPDLIEIVPLEKPVRAEITVPGSKSITNRALILAALAHGETTLQGALWSEDTQVMVEALGKLGFQVRLENDPHEFCNRTITVKGLGGKIPNGGTEEKPFELFVGNAGTAARFLAALVCLGPGVYRLYGVPRMHERPQAALFSALRELGYGVESESQNDKLPAKIFGVPISSLPPQRVQPGTGRYPGLRARSCSVSIQSSSQFASALLLCADVAGWTVRVEGESEEESPYVAMTTALIKAFPRNGGNFRIEPDASSGSYFIAAGHLTSEAELHSSGDGLMWASVIVTRSVAIINWPKSGWQVDERFRLASSVTNIRHSAVPAGAHDSHTGLPDYALKLFKDGSISRRSGLGDSIMTMIVTAPLGPQPVRFTDLGRLRLQECERVSALQTELTKCGAKVIEEGDTLTVYPSELHGAEIETYNDHRMAMCFATLGLKVSGMKIRNPSCVKKTFPNFFQKLAGQPPSGLGATILDARSGLKLRLDELFAE